MEDLLLMSGRTFLVTLEVNEIKEEAYSVKLASVRQPKVYY
jgi:hypothetical protein